MAPDTQEHTLESLEAASGFSARTIRYYISQGLVPPPRAVGRNAAYGPEHLDLLKRIAQWKQEGMSLDEIRSKLDPKPVTPSVVPEPWFVYRVAEDVEVRVRGGLAPWRRRHLDKALTGFMTAITRKPEGSEEG